MRSSRYLKNLIFIQSFLFLIVALCALFLDGSKSSFLVFSSLLFLFFLLSGFSSLRLMHREVKERSKNIVDERNEKETILEPLDEGVIVVGESLSIRYVNAAGSRLLGIPKRHLLGKLFPIIEDKPISELLKKCYYLLTTCQQKSMTLTDSVSLGEGKKVYLDLIAAPKPQGSGAIIILQDKSSHRRILEMGKDFVSNASHELRTPITIIRGFAETLQDMPDLPREMTVEIIEKIVRNCQRMDNLVKNLLTLADIENLPESRFQECDLASIAEASKRVVSSIYETAQIEIKKREEPCIVFADPDILELAIINLIDNAAKYSQGVPQINITIEERNGEAILTIQDKGIGIPPHDLECIFERFYTVNKAHSRRLGGAGLGLSIVKTIIEKHDGSISVQSELGKGTTFIVIVPKAGLPSAFASND